MPLLHKQYDLIPGASPGIMHARKVDWQFSWEANWAACSVHVSGRAPFPNGPGDLVTCRACRRILHIVNEGPPPSQPAIERPWSERLQDYFISTSRE